MKNGLMAEEWAVLARLLPAEWRELAREKGAIQRARGPAQSPEVLLRMILMHVATGLSLKQTVARAHMQGLATMSDVALLKRLRTSEGWLRDLSQKLFERGRLAVTMPQGLASRRVRAVDATTVEEPGATGTDWRVHYVIGLPSLCCDFYELTDAKGGESYKRVPVSPGDVILADRGYCHREGVAHVVDGGADVLVRLNSATFPMLHKNSVKQFDLLAHLRTLEATKPGEWKVAFVARGGIYTARVCAMRKSVAAAEAAKVKILKVANKKGKQVLPSTLEFAEFIFVLTTLKCDEADTAAVLTLYRARWQIELCFKRIKSLLRLGHLPKRSDESARAWIQGKLLTVLLIERLIEEARFFSPWGYPISD